LKEPGFGTGLAQIGQHKNRQRHLAGGGMFGFQELWAKSLSLQGTRKLEAKLCKINTQLKNREVVCFAVRFAHAAQPMFRN